MFHCGDILVSTVLFHVNFFMLNYIYYIILTYSNSYKYNRLLHTVKNMFLLIFIVNFFF